MAKAGPSVSGTALAAGFLHGEPASTTPVASAIPLKVKAGELSGCARHHEANDDAKGENAEHRRCRDAEPSQQFDALFLSGQLRERFHGQIHEDTCWLIQNKIVKNRNRESVPACFVLSNIKANAMSFSET